MYGAQHKAWASDCKTLAKQAAELGGEIAAHSSPNTRSGPGTAISGGNLSLGDESQLYRQLNTRCLLHTVHCTPASHGIHARQSSSPVRQAEWQEEKTRRRRRQRRSEALKERRPERALPRQSIDGADRAALARLLPAAAGDAAARLRRAEDRLARRRQARGAARER